jgi:ankyrin repeat protein
MSDTIAIHEAYVRGDLAALRGLLDHPPDFPNCRGPQGVGEIILQYAIYWSPLEFIRTLLELGANPNYEDSGGFPSLFAALSAKREDRRDILTLLLSFGANCQQRGINGYTPLHLAAALDDPVSIELLLSHGADPKARTPIDEHATPSEEAQRLSRWQAVEALRTSPSKANR